MFQSWTKESRQVFRGIPMHVNDLDIRIFYVSVLWLYYTGGI